MSAVVTHWSSFVVEVPWISLALQNLSSRFALRFVRIVDSHQRFALANNMMHNDTLINLSMEDSEPVLSRSGPASRR